MSSDQLESALKRISEELRSHIIETILATRYDLDDPPTNEILGENSKYRAHAQRDMAEDIEQTPEIQQLLKDTMIDVKTSLAGLSEKQARHMSLDDAVRFYCNKRPDGDLDLRMDCLSDDTGDNTTNLNKGIYNTHTATVSKPNIQTDFVEEALPKAEKEAIHPISQSLSHTAVENLMLTTQRVDSQWDAENGISTVTVGSQEGHRKDRDLRSWRETNWEDLANRISPGLHNWVLESLSQAYDQRVEKDRLWQGTFGGLSLRSDFGKVTRGSSTDFDPDLNPIDRVRFVLESRDGFFNGLEVTRTILLKELLDDTPLNDH
ncbi:hypothetical protein L486_08268 [Kwoniella mangroviensis CBS 10435]|uniref:Uncharacterized protein n=1 Tax=Kwoniella mangroviensis CBS 10435 TaxID=1331196 RepID=A0A1B9IFZ5_9TREE|nr:hypothetical protein L486_08268 [Kwoniella mangroviensis CBS 10435]